MRKDHSKYAVIVPRQVRAMQEGDLPTPLSYEAATQKRCVSNPDSVLPAFLHRFPHPLRVFPSVVFVQIGGLDICR
jgi:hypothetical protein